MNRFRDLLGTNCSCTLYLVTNYLRLNSSRIFVGHRSRTIWGIDSNHLCDVSVMVSDGTIVINRLIVILLFSNVLRVHDDDLVLVIVPDYSLDQIKDSIKSLLNFSNTSNNNNCNNNNNSAVWMMSMKSVLWLWVRKPLTSSLTRPANFRITVCLKMTSSTPWKSWLSWRLQFRLSWRLGRTL